MTDSLLFVARRPPFPLQSGGRIRSYKLLTGLSGNFRTTLVTYEHHPDSGEGSCTAAELRERLPGVRVLTVPGLGPLRRRSIASSLVSTRSWGYGRYPERPLRDTLLEVAGREEASLVHFEDLGVGLAGPVPGRVNVLSTQNVEYRLARNLAKAYGGRRRLFTALDWRKMAREESRTWRAMSLVLAVSEVDAQVMRDAGAREVIVCPNGTDAVAPLPPPRRQPGEPLRVMFLGSGHYRPNDLGLRWFVEEVLPVVREQVEVEFLVVGDPPPNRPEADGVRYVGRVPTVTPWYEQCHAVVVPLLQSGGTRLKIIEAIAHGRPVVSTGVGAEGLPLTAGVHYLRADDPGAFAQALAHLASQAESDGQGTRALLDAARTAIAELLWPNIVDKLTVTYRSLLRT